MERVKYFKDLNHNYLIIHTYIKEEKPDYQHKMITENHIKKLLSCKIRYINEECHFYYEISSKQSIKNVFDKKKMDFEQIFRLFESLRDVEKEMENFLLDSRCLLLCPEYIYTEPETGEYFFIYYPYYMEETEEINDEHNMTIMSLPLFLIDTVNHDEMEAVNAVYKIYELIQDNKFIISEAMKIFETGNESIEKYNSDTPVSDTSSNYINYDSCDNKQLTDYNTEIKGMQEEIKGNNAPALILSAICAAAASAVFCICYFFSLSFEEKIISAAGIIFLVILSGFFLVYFLFNFSKHKCGGLKHDQSGMKKSLIENKEQVLQQEIKTLTYTEAMNYTNTGHQEKRNKVNITTNEDNAEDYGKTVFLETSAMKSENKLYGTNKGNKYHIDLTNLPCIIGKLAGSVDIVIKDRTISRIHAKITQQMEEIYVTDMNSTNGTFKNGLRLDPNEMVLIEPGDELRFGEMTFSYR